MIQLIKNIAFLLFGIFFFPITFQSIHIVWHHSHAYKSEHHLCQQELSDKHSHTNSENLSEDEKTCTICEYQISINDLPKFPFSGLEIPVFACIYNEIATQQHYKQVFSDKTPRAPPVLVS